MRVDVVFTPDEAGAAPTGIVIDVIRATSTICQALVSGYKTVFCAADVDEARALRDALGEGVLGGERNAVRIPGFDLGNSPREYLELIAETLVLSTTNGTRAVVAAAGRCERVLIASLLNLSAVVEAARDAGDDVLVVCAGVQGTLALDDAFVAGRIVELLGCERTDAADAAARLTTTWTDAEEAFRASKSGRNLMENAPELEADIPFCARESVLDVVPRLVGMRAGAAEITP
ncbi:MAG: 2-phosphosulfolactate phosphatase [Thermoleophilia bacterium]|nr:2-phosphosulfolactate phosphatase [Thermoleophilia bacterium]MDH4340808.1 2-phosphosulfolactate phosphatase [Thermoleophilia bacterium]MDH5280880.1 2-phosphosulfolactate phosphatase [Thermoleophilia bacterium]